MTKAEMLFEMRDNGWVPAVDVHDSYEDIKDEYETFKDEISDDSDMYPNGHDDGEDPEYC
jgi:hypothetical protein